MSGFIRVLQCFTCRSMEELPDYEGLPEHDVTLQHVITRHGAGTQNAHPGALHRVEKRFWDDRGVRRQIVSGMWKDTKGFVPEYYASKNTFQEEAAKCFAAHRRSVPCIDYQDRSKRLGNPAAVDRKALSKDTRHDVTGGGPKVFLCNFCVYQTHVDQMKYALNEGHQY